MRVIEAGTPYLHRQHLAAELDLLPPNVRLSEGQHVDWAWKQGLLREYSAWAVALGAADAWGKALEHSNVPAPEMNIASPLWLYSMGPSFDSTRSAPAPSGGSSGSSFGGGFSGGVGGGGGGGSSGSW